MKNIIEKEVNVGGRIFNRKMATKVGIEGGKLHDEIVSRTNELICFHDIGKAYYLYSLVSGKLIAISDYHRINCINDKYYELNSCLKCLFYVDNDIDTLIINSCIKDYPTKTKKFDYKYNILIEYLDDKRICVTYMDTNEKFEFQDDRFLDYKFIGIYFTRNYKDSYPSYMIKVEIDFKDHIYYNLFNTLQNKFVLNSFVESDIKDLVKYKNETYIITYNNKLIDQNENMIIEESIEDLRIYDDRMYIITCSNRLIDLEKNIIIDSFYDKIFFHDKLPYVYLVKHEKEGLADLNGNIIFDAIYDEVMETPEKFVVNVQETKEYIKKEIEK